MNSNQLNFMQHVATTERKRGKLSPPLPALVTRLTILDVLLSFEELSVDGIIRF